MSSLEKSDLVTPSVQWRWPSVHPDGRKFVVIAAAVALLFWFVIDWDWLGYLDRRARLLGSPPSSAIRSAPPRRPRG